MYLIQLYFLMDSAFQIHKSERVVSERLSTLKANEG